MKTNMAKSGTHDNEPWNFVEVAMRQHSGFTKIAVYYFYMRCESVPDVDSVFQPFLDSSIKGSSVEINHESTVPSTGKKRKKNDDAIEVLLEQSSAMIEMLRESRATQSKLAEAAAQQQNLNQRIKIAKALDDTATLQSLMEELKSSQST